MENHGNARHRKRIEQILDGSAKNRKARHEQTHGDAKYRQHNETCPCVPRPPRARRRRDGLGQAGARRPAAAHDAEAREGRLQREGGPEGSSPPGRSGSQAQGFPTNKSRDTVGGKIYCIELISHTPRIPVSMLVLGFAAGGMMKVNVEDGVSKRTHH